MVLQLRKALPFLTAAILAAGAYDGWLLYSRWRDGRESKRGVQAREAEAARRTIDLLGGGGLKILSFYASPRAIHLGARANICYGVYGAKSVRIEPRIAELRPAVSHCLQASPDATTTYKLVAEDESGHTVTEQFVLEVVP